MNTKINEIKKIMENIKYGFKDDNGKNIIDEDSNKWENDFNNFYHLQSPEELIISRCGVCFDQVELERKLFEERKIDIKTYFIFIEDKDKLPSHTFLTFERDKNYYWFEHSWKKFKGIYEYSSEIELLRNVKNHFTQEYNPTNDNINIYIYEYNKPKYHITCDEFYKYIETQKLIKFDKSDIIKFLNKKRRNYG